MGEGLPGRSDVAAVPGKGDGATVGGDACAPRFRGTMLVGASTRRRGPWPSSPRITTSRRRHPTTMTHDDRGTAGGPTEPAAWTDGHGPPSDNEPGVAVGSVGEPPRRRRHRARAVLWSVLALVVVAVVVASRWNLDFYAFQPGSAQSVQQFIAVPPDRAHPVRHPVLLTDVQVARVTALSYLYFRLQSDTALQPLTDVTGGTDPSEQAAQGQLEMSQAEDAAKAAALVRLGYKVGETAAGAVIAGTFSGTPAYGALSVGDVVTAVDGTETPTAEALTTALSRFHSGQTVTLTVRRGGTRPPGPVPVTLRRTEVDLGGGVTASLDLGIEPEDQVDFAYPFPISINVTNIGGPSAGLAMTLGVIDALTGGSLTGRNTVAATGTISADGDVGDVGGVPQKTVAVERAGAVDLLRPTAGVPGGDDRGPGRSVHLQGVDARPSARRAGRPRWHRSSATDGGGGRDAGSGHGRGITGFGKPWS